MNDPDPDRPREGSSRLDYRPREADRAPISMAQALGGFVIGMAVVGAAVFFAVVSSLTFGGRRQTSMAPFLVAASCAVLIANGLAIITYRSRKWRGFAIGVWIGFGIAVLAEGICFIR
jgi:hypothetical protein